eukprot:CAMPEP_0170080450 /NCGR_PEP_ID=MMETSP0019_2-20121128/16591_1 /TAXON_ID=98059 /ORGANISM="Dinobryon sp., Strain UTEXLB2267" /LENGTH=52 /DNA_ID=CAMNT_0010294439 /DNA_START=839 /DNA_END=997 /DNA_ORIENTATION=-
MTVRLCLMVVGRVVGSIVGAIGLIEETAEDVKVGFPVGNALTSLDSKLRDGK